MPYTIPTLVQYFKHVPDLDGSFNGSSAHHKARSKGIRYVVLQFVMPGPQLQPFVESFRPNIGGGPI